MKHIHLVPVLFLFLSIISFTSCDDDGEFAIPPVQFVSKAAFTRLVDGKAWKYVESHEIKNDATMMAADYWDGLIGGAPEQYSFSGGELTTYMYIDSYPMKCYRTVEYTFVEGKNQVMSGTNDVFTVVSVSADRLCIIKHQATRADGKDIYVYAVYRAMTDYEQASLRQDYPYNLNTLSEDYPELPEQTAVTEADFTSLAVGQAWQCAKAHALFAGNRYCAADFFASGTELKPIDYEITADTVYETTRGGDPSTATRKGYTYTFNANGRYVETQGGTTFRIISLTADEMHMLQTRTWDYGRKHDTLYCIYRRTDAIRQAERTLFN